MADCKKIEGQKIDKKDRDGNSPLLVASKGGHAEVVEMLLNLGSSVNVINNSGETALHLASKEGHEEVVKHLLKAGADPSVEDMSGTTPWHTAAAGGYASILSLFAAERIQKEDVDGNGNNSLHRAALKGDTVEVVRLIKSGVSLDKQNLKGETPLHLAATCGHDKIVKILLDSGADLWVESEDFSNAFHAASKAGSISVLQFLASKDDSRVDKTQLKRNKNSNGILQDSKKDKKIEKKCENTTYSLGIQDKRKCSSHLNSDQKKEKISSRLNNRIIKLQKSVNEPSLSSMNIKPGSDWKAIYKKTELMCLSSDSDEEDVTNLDSFYFMNLVLLPLFDDEVEHREETKRHVLKKLINDMSGNDIDLTRTNRQGFTVLHLAAGTGAEKAVAEYLKSNSRLDINARAVLGITPMMMAAAGGSVAIMKMLIKAGADPKDNNNAMRCSTLHFAAFHRNLEAVKFLISLGLSPNKQDNNGSTPLHFAVSRTRNFPVVQALLNLGACVHIKNKIGLLPCNLIAEDKLLDILSPEVRL